MHLFSSADRTLTPQKNALGNFINKNILNLNPLLMSCKNFVLLVIGNFSQVFNLLN